MKNIFEIMKDYGLEVPEDKKKDFEKAVLENYKTAAELNDTPFLTYHSSTTFCIWLF